MSTIRARVALVGGLAAAAEVLLVAPPVRADESILYLNRCQHGATVWPAWEDDSTLDLSAILDDTAELPPFPYDDDTWDEVVRVTRELFAPFALYVTDVDPGEVPHDEVFVCGAGWNVGLDDGYWGMAPFDCEAEDGAVTFVFPEEIGDAPVDIGETIAQEAAHAWGLDHSFSCEDPMGYLWGCGAKQFVDDDVACGEYRARACGCGGRTQNTYAHLVSIFGEREPDIPADAIDPASPSPSPTAPDAASPSCSVGPRTGVPWPLGALLLVVVVRRGRTGLSAWGDSGVRGSRCRSAPRRSR